MKYCEFCGKELEDNAVCNCEEAVEQRENKKDCSVNNHNFCTLFKKYKIPIIAGIVSFVALIVVSVVFTETNKLDPFDYTEVSFFGYNTNGTMKVDFKKEQLIEDLIGSEPSNFEDLELWIKQYEELSEGIKCDYDENKTLSNGDSITVSFYVSNEFKNKVLDNKKEYVVSGLKEVKTVDVFSNIEIEYTGVNGEASAKVKISSDDEFINECNFLFIKANNLSSGETVTVLVENIDDLAMDYGCIPEPSSKDFEVPDLPKYVESADELSHDVIKTIANKFVDKINSEKEDNFLFTYSVAKYHSAYFCKQKESAPFTKINLLRIYVTYDEYLKGSLSRTIYMPIEFKNIVIASDGSFDLNYDDGVESSFSTDLTGTINELTEKYDVYEINIT